jgi:Uma2 family endonuclease
VAELVDGGLYVSPRPAIPHAVATAELFGELTDPFGKGGWRLLFAPELHLGEDVLVPDLAGRRRARMPRAPHTVGGTLAPDWLCEVLSPSTRALDRKVKLPVYARVGVRHVWLVDPDARTLEVLRLEAAHYLPLATYEGQASVRAEPFEALTWELNLLWEE